MKQPLLPISLSLLLSLLYSTTLALATQSPSIAPVQHIPTPPAASPTTTAPLVPTLPQSPSDNTPDTGGTNDIVGILRRANSFNVFIRLMKTTQLVNQLNSQLITIKSGGLTILAPEDSAFSELKPGFLNSLSDGKKLELLQFHVLPDYVSSSNFDTLTNPVRTLAGNKHGKVELNVISYGGSVNISTGQVNTTITGIIYTDKHLAIYKVGKVLVPSEFFPTKTIAAAPTLAPAPATDAAMAPKSDKQKPSSSEDSSETSQVVPTETSGAMRRISFCGTLVSLVLGVVFVAVFTK
ncbi:fasciclin-like arabinogalactan protein 12 [Abrus precatorius]|uniref:Fasciclin-like arabinogalactan protein 12 n=1 Tax=Abrus precatorius TaxID=3816 RepID=A0A8B8KEE6_ABRPR|nr:fasciclin-like arabinogalactan protein 12 [Abrus precatorius]